MLGSVLGIGVTANVRYKSLNARFLGLGVGVNLRFEG